MRSFEHVLVDGQLALTYDYDRQVLLQYAYTLLGRVSLLTLQPEDQRRGQSNRHSMLRSRSGAVTQSHVPWLQRAM